MQVLNNIAAKYTNYFDDCIDAAHEKDPELKSLKVSSAALKAFGALMMVSGAATIIGTITAIPSVGLSLFALVNAVGLAILGYDFAEIGDAIQRNIKNPVGEIAKSIFGMPKNMWKMGAEKGALYSVHGHYCKETYIVSNIVKLAIGLAEFATEMRSKQTRSKR